MLHSSRELQVNKDQIEGATQKGVGAVKDALGKVTGNDKLRAEGIADKVVGGAKEAIGNVKGSLDREAVELDKENKA